MIFIDRANINPNGPACLDLTDKNSLASIELKNNKNAFSKGQSLQFSVYGREDVKDSLKKLFNDKCAYCESKMLHVSDSDIEHFRPKGEMKPTLDDKLNDEETGYYWLAAKWDNLLLSCEHCNQRRVDSKGRVFGKGIYFPIDGNKKIHKQYGDKNFSKEESKRLIINPCIDTPEDFLEFCANGNIIAKKKSLKGECSIKVYGLRRYQLIIERRVEIKKLKLQLESLKIHLISKDKTINGISKDRFVDSMFDSILQLYFSKNSPYLAYKRDLLKEFKKFWKNYKKGIIVP